MEKDLVRKRPNFVVAGAAKSGSTSLYEYLKQHPQVFLPEIKESRYFASEKLENTLGYNRTSIFKESAFLGLYESVGAQHSAIGDFGNLYMLFPEVAIPNIKQCLGDRVKIVFVIRNPVPRALSAYKMARRNFYEDQSFEKGLDLEESRLKEGYVPPDIIAYYHSGDYYPGVKQFADHFDTHVMLLEDLLDRPQQTMDELFGFLEVDPMVLEGFNKVHNKGTAPPKGGALLFRIQKAVKVIGAPVVSMVPGLRKASAWVFKQMFSLSGKGKVEEVKFDPATERMLKDKYIDNTKALSGLIGRDLVELWKLEA